MADSTLVQQLLNGLTLGCLYSLIALGYTLIFGVMSLIFFAQGEICMFGAFGGIGALSLFGGRGPVLTPLIAVLGAVSGAVVAGLLAERLAMRPLRQAPRTKQLIASLGVPMVLQNVVLLWTSSENIPFPRLLPGKSWLSGSTVVTPVQAFIWACSVLLMLGLEWLLH